jgi:hypothetical protein
LCALPCPVAVAERFSSSPAPDPSSARFTRLRWGQGPAVTVVNRNPGRGRPGRVLGASPDTSGRRRGR